MTVYAAQPSVINITIFSLLIFALNADKEVIALYSLDASQAALVTGISHGRDSYCFWLWGDRLVSTTMSHWCRCMVICTKTNGKPRWTVDFQALNLHAMREIHHTESPFHQAHCVPGGTKKTVFVCWNGFHHVPLHPDDRHLTALITPWGRYQYKTAPQGYMYRIR